MARAERARTRGGRSAGSRRCSRRRRARSRSPRACGRARSTSSSGRSICSRRESRCARRSSAARSASMIFWGPPGTGKTTLALAASRATPIASSSRSPPSPKACRACARSSPRRRTGSPRWAAARSSSPTRSIASTRRSRTRFCRTSKRGTITLDRRDDGESVVRDQRRAALARARVRAQAAHADDIATLLARALDDRERGLGALELDGRRRRARDCIADAKPTATRVAR